MEKRVQIGLKLPPSLVEAVDRARLEMEFPPDRTEIIERALLDWLERKAQREKRKERR